MKDKTFMALSSLFFLLFFVAVGSITLNRPLSGILKAKNVAPSPLKSFAVVFPQVAKISDSRGGNGTKIKVSVYIRGVDGSILPNRTVKLTADNPSVSIEPADSMQTNDIGQAEFLVASQEAGKTKVTATEVATNTQVINIPTIEFIK